MLRKKILLALTFVVLGTLAWMRVRVEPSGAMLESEISPFAGWKSWSAGSMTPSGIGMGQGAPHT